MQYLGNLKNSQTQRGSYQSFRCTRGGMQITVTDTSTMNTNGLVFTASTVSINGVAHPEPFTYTGFLNGANTIFGTVIETGSVYIVH